MPVLTLRNLSNTPLRISKVSRYILPDPPKPEPISHRNITNFGNLSHNFTTLLAKTPISSYVSSAEITLPPDAQPSKSEDVRFRLDPFTSLQTKIEVEDCDGKEVLRIHFEAVGDGGGWFSADIYPCAKKPTVKVIPDEAGERKNYTAVFHRSQVHLAIMSSTDLNGWQGHLKDSTPLSALSIPGTHNSPTCHVALPSVRCQAVKITEQLENGIRFFDVRCQPDDKGREMILVHGAFPISLKRKHHLKELLKDTYDFLDAHPTESVIISLKREGRGDYSDETFSLLIKDWIEKDPHRWYTDVRSPTLGNVRGKCILLRRFHIDETLQEENDGRGWGINAEEWTYNTPNETIPSGKIVVQDFCEVLETENIDKKTTYVKEQLERSGGVECDFALLRDDDPDTGTPPFYLNFLSASNFWKRDFWPERIAARLNPATVEHLAANHDTSKGDGGTGIVISDYAGENGDWDLVRLVVSMNGCLEKREREWDEREREKKEREAAERREQEEIERQEEERMRKQQEEEGTKNEEEQEEERMKNEEEQEEERKKNEEEQESEDEESEEKPREEQDLKAEQESISEANNAEKNNPKTPLEYRQLPPEE
ncbi:hypothetical protein RUND412_005868 [Rhizina undulata]